MMLNDILTEVDITDRLVKDPQRMRMLMLALKHDGSLPRNVQAKLGPRHTDAEAARVWSDALSHALSRTNYGDLSRDYKFADYLTKLYSTGTADFEDITGEGGDALGAWNALSVRGKLKPQHSDLNRFTSIQQIHRAFQDQDYRRELERIKNAERVNKMKKDAKAITLIDDGRFQVTMPINYGACYVWNNTNHPSTFCTGSSSDWQFTNYASRGPIFTILDKANPDSVNGKWQMHATSQQLHNSTQESHPLPGMGNDESFAKLFPGLMRRIAQAAAAHRAEIEAAGREIAASTRSWKGADGYDLSKELVQMKKAFPLSWASRSAADEPEPEAAPVQERPWYQRYLHPEFRSNVPDIPEGQSMVLKAVKIGDDGGRKNMSGRATSMVDLLDRILRQKPNWLQDGTIVSVGPAD